MICALNSVAAVGFNRYLLLCMTKDIYYRFTRHSSIAISLVVIWVWSFLIVLPPMVGYGEFGYHIKFKTCFFQAYNHESWMYGTIFCCVLGVFPPVIASTFFYGKIMLKLAENRRNLMKHYLPPISKITSSTMFKDKGSGDDLIAAKRVTISDSETSNLSQRSSAKIKKKTKTNALLLRQNNQQRRSALMLITVFAVIVMCWLPISLSFMSDKENKLPSIVYVSFVILAWMNSCVNIFIYCGMNLQFRKAYISVFTACTHRRRKLSTLNSSVSGLGTGQVVDSVTETKS